MKKIKVKQNNKLKEIVIKGEREGLIFTVGSLKYKMLPTYDMIHEIQTLIEKTMKDPTFILVLPPYVSWKKVEFGKKKLVKKSKSNTKGNTKGNTSSKTKRKDK